MSIKQSDSTMKLLQSLRQLLAIYQELIKSAEDKKNILIAGQDEQLQQLTARESELLERFAAADRSRIEAIGELQVKSGVAVRENMTLTEVRTLLPDEGVQSDLREVQQQLTEAARQLQDLNERNQLLLKQDIAVTSDKLDTILGPVESDYTYEHPNIESPSVKRANGIDFRY